MLARLVQAEGQSSGGGLIDDPQNLQSGDGAGILCCLPLIVIEVGGDGDDSSVHAVSEIGLGIGLDLPQDLSGDILGGILLAEDPDLIVSPHLSLYALNSALGIGHSLPLRRLAHQDLTLFGEGDKGWEGLASDAGPLCTGDYGGPATDQGGCCRVAGTKINAYNF